MHVIQVVCKGGPSLREAIANYRGIKNFSLRVIKQKQPGRRHGWTKIHGSGHGALNLVWDANTRILSARVVTRGRTSHPNRLIADFVNLLLGSRLKGKVEQINILRR